MQVEQRIAALPDSPLAASAAYFADHLAAACAMIEGEGDSLAIILPQASIDHDNWRRTLAADLAREYTPKRVNVVAGGGANLSATLTYLANAPGVTGQYCPTHE